MGRSRAALQAITSRRVPPPHMPHATTMCSAAPAQEKEKEKEKEKRRLAQGSLRDLASTRAQPQANDGAAAVHPHGILSAQAVLEERERG
jgi:hypothetical protein